MSINNSNQRHRIIIVGGGPTGLATALHIAKRSPELAHDMLILEGKTYPRPKLCGGGITVHGEEQLAALQLKPDVQAFHIHKLVFKLGRLTFGVPHENAMRVIDRAEFDAAIADAVVERGLQIHTGEKVLDVCEHPDYIELVTSRRTYQTDVLVAADGAKSTVRQKLRIRGTQGIARLLRVMTPVEPERSQLWQDSAAVFDFSCVEQGVQGYQWDFPSFLDGQPVMNRGIFDSRIDTTVEKSPHGTLKQAFSNGLQQRQVELSASTLEGHPVRWFDPTGEFSRNRILLAGDAAGVDPLFAEGISYGMEYGGIVASIIDDAFRRGDFSFSDYREQLLKHRLGQLLHRRTIVARHLYTQRLPALWRVLWHCADIAPRIVQRRIAASLALLPK